MREGLRVVGRIRGWARGVRERLRVVGKGRWWKVKLSEHAWKRCCVCPRDVRNWRSCKWHRCSFDIFWLGNNNTSFNFTKTKKNSYYLNLFHERIYFRIYVGFPHPRLNVSPNTFSLATDASIVHQYVVIYLYGLP